MINPFLAAVPGPTGAAVPPRTPVTLEHQPNAPQAALAAPSQPAPEAQPAASAQAVSADQPQPDTQAVPPSQQNPSVAQPAPTQQPAFQQPAFQQPAFQQPAFQQPAFQQPTQSPAPQQPAPMQTSVPQNLPAGAIPLAGHGPTVGSVVNLDDEISINKLERLPKLTKDQTIRLCFLAMEPGPTGRLKLLFKQSLTFWDKAKEFGFIAPEENPQLMAELVKKYGEPKMRFVTIVGRYTTDAAGTITGTEVKKFAFVVGTDKFPELQRIHKQWDLSSRDFTMTCTEPNYQKCTIMPCPERFLSAPQAAGMNAQLISEALGLFGSTMDFYLGRKAPYQEIMEKCFGAAPAVSQAPAGYNPFAIGAQAQLPHSAGMVGAGSAQATNDFGHLVSAATQGVRAQ